MNLPIKGNEKTGNLKEKEGLLNHALVPDCGDSRIEVNGRYMEKHTEHSTYPNQYKQEGSEVWILCETVLISSTKTKKVWMYVFSQSWTEICRPKTSKGVFILHHSRQGSLPQCNKYFVCTGGKTSNLSKHLADVHHIQMEKCTVFGSLASYSSLVSPSPSGTQS